MQGKEQCFVAFCPFERREELTIKKEGLLEFIEAWYPGRLSLG